MFGKMSHNISHYGAQQSEKMSIKSEGDRILNKLKYSLQNVAVQITL